MSEPKNRVIILGGEPYKLTWDRAALCRADDMGMYGSEKQGVGFAKAAKYVFVMLPEKGRDKFETFVDVSRVLPPLNEVWPIINAALADGGDEVDPKKVFGSTSGRSPASSSV